jgi:hypothetical protein
MLCAYPEPWLHRNDWDGAGRGSRTPKTRRSADFESAASASSAIPALVASAPILRPILHHTLRYARTIKRVTVQQSVSLLEDWHMFFILPFNLILSRFHAKISAMQIPKTNRLYHPIPPAAAQSRYCVAWNDVCRRTAEVSNTGSGCAR